MAKISLSDAIHSQRAVRRFKPDPVPDQVVRQLLSAATRAPSGANQQPWYFVVIRDPDTKRLLGAWYLEAWEAYYTQRKRTLGTAPSADYLARHMEEVPVFILVCMDTRRYGASPGPLTRGASIYPAVQNLLLSARGLGLGSTLTTLYTLHESDLKAYLGIPDYIETAALIPLGYPDEGERFGGSRRKPVEEVAFSERWDQTR